MRAVPASAQKRMVQPLYYFIGKKPAKFSLSRTTRRNHSRNLTAGHAPPVVRFLRIAPPGQMTPAGIRTISSSATSPHSTSRNVRRFFGSMSGT